MTEIIQFLTVLAFKRLNLNGGKNEFVSLNQLTSLFLSQHVDDNILCDSKNPGAKGTATCRIFVQMPPNPYPHFLFDFVHVVLVDLTRKFLQ